MCVRPCVFVSLKYVWRRKERLALVRTALFVVAVGDTVVGFDKQACVVGSSDDGIIFLLFSIVFALSTYSGVYFCVSMCFFSSTVTVD